MRLVLISLFAVGGMVAGAFVWLSSTGEPQGVRVRLDFSQASPSRTRGGPTAPLRLGRDNGGRNDDRALTRRVPLRSVRIVPALLEKGPHGALPRIASDGRAAWRVYGRPHDRSDRRPRIAVIITDLGLKKDVTESAIEDLPGVVTLAFSIYGRDLKTHAAAARKAGHEVLVTLPLETAEDSGHDPGPRALVASLSARQNRDRLYWIMGRTPGYVGLVAWPVGVFSRKGPLKEVLGEARKRGILVIDGRPGPREDGAKLFAPSGVVWSKVTVWLDREPSPNALDAAFRKAEATARRAGAAIVIGQPYPLTLTRVRSWLESFSRKGLVPAPVSAVVRAGS
jgi:polysaccharide deacetylase 2 family uncharacterized protein YibQ